MKSKETKLIEKALVGLYRIVSGDKKATFKSIIKKSLELYKEEDDYIDWGKVFKEINDGKKKQAYSCSDCNWIGGEDQLSHDSIIDKDVDGNIIESTIIDICPNCGGQFIMVKMINNSKRK